MQWYYVKLNAAPSSRFNECACASFTIRNAGELSDKEKQWKINSVQIELCTYSRRVGTRASECACARFMSLQQKRSQCNWEIERERAEGISFWYLHGTIRSMNDKYWNMLYDHRAPCKQQQLSHAHSALLALPLSLAMRWPSQNNFFFSVVLWHIQWCEFWSCCCYVRVVSFFSSFYVARGSFNSSSSEELWIKCNARWAHNENICI